MDNITLPKMELRHEKKENSKRDICAYSFNNPATFEQIKEATGLSESYLRYLIIQLKKDCKLKKTIVFNRKLSRSIFHYESNAEYVPIKYVRKSRFEVPKQNKILSDELISTVIKKLATDSPKAIAFELNENLGRIYWIRKKYGNLQ
jgi:hypothetical protein